MSLELLKSIESAEGKAETIRANAQRESREILKGVEEAIVTNERNAALEHRALAQRIAEEAREAASRRIDEAGAQEAQAREKVTAAARARLDDAANMIFERVMRDGHR